MPFKSKKQMRYMFMKGKKDKHMMEVAEEMAHKTDMDDLPEKIEKKSGDGFRKSMKKRNR